MMTMGSLVDENGVVGRLEAALAHMSASKAELATAMGKSKNAVGAVFGPGRRRPETLANVVSGLNAMAEARGMARRWTVAELLGEEPPAPPSPTLPTWPAEVLQSVVARSLDAFKLTPARDLSLTSVRSLGRLPCGTPLVLGDHVDMVDVLTRDLPREWDETCFIGTADGDSMIGLGIVDGSTLYIKPSQELRDGAIVVAMVDGETTCKRLQRAGSAWVLQPANPAHAPLVLSQRNEVEIVGRIIAHRAPLVSL